MNSTNFIDYILYFMIYSFLGWIVEVLYVGIRSRKFTNRGFLYSPFLPIYGFGAIFIIILLEPVKNSIVLVFILGISLATILEYASAAILENIFHIKWWDYSNYKYNFQGRICLRNSVLFGILGVILIYVIHPIISNFIGNISLNIKDIIVDISLMILIIDLYFTVIKLSKMPIRHIHLLNTKHRNIEDEIKKLGYNLLNPKYKNEGNKIRLNFILTVAILSGIVLIFFVNVYIALLVTLIVLIVLYAFFRQNKNNEKKSKKM